MVSGSHCTFAVTDDAPVNVKVQVFRLLPALEQAPDQIASRPLVTLKVIEAPVANDADPELPTLTLMPAGLDVTRSPLRPDAVTVSVAVPEETDPCGVKRRAVENGPKTPDAFRARTRHHSVCAGSPADSVACDAVVVGLAMNGAAIVELSSTCTS
jgi:hypothetical protein